MTLDNFVSKLVSELDNESCHKQKWFALFCFSQQFNQTAQQEFIYFKLSVYTLIL